MVRGQIDLFRSIVLEGIVLSAVFEHKLQRFFFIVFDHHFTGDDKVYGRLQEIDDSDRISVDIALPADPEPGADM